jgi:hypothetical protein
MDGILTCESEKQIFLVLPLNAWKRLLADLILGTLLGPEGTKVRFWALKGQTSNSFKFLNEQVSGTKLFAKLIINDQVQRQFESRPYLENCIVDASI